MDLNVASVEDWPIRSFLLDERNESWHLRIINLYKLKVRLSNFTDNLL